MDDKDSVLFEGPALESPGHSVHFSITKEGFKEDLSYIMDDFIYGEVAASETDTYVHDDRQLNPRVRKFLMDRNQQAKFILEAVDRIQELEDEIKSLNLQSGADREPAESIRSEKEQRIVQIAANIHNGLAKFKNAIREIPIGPNLDKNSAIKSKKVIILASMLISKVKENPSNSKIYQNKRKFDELFNKSFYPIKLLDTHDSSNSKSDILNTENHNN